MESRPRSERQRCWLLQLSLALTVFVIGCSDHELRLLPDDEPPAGHEPPADEAGPLLDDGPPSIEVIDPVEHMVYGTDFPVSLMARVDQ